ncbi:MAG TPA: thiamine-phosphate kinase [Anaeromyxobacter sp.]|nr:thiamine-phosphate kinase [Anaeromyxobacter sp.]
MRPRSHGARAKAGEFALIARFVRAVPVHGRGVAVGPGDDAAVLGLAPGEELVATVDAVVEGVHLDRRATPDDAGWKALAVNLSDLAAMGARPLWALVALGLPAGTPDAAVRGLARGLGACARAHGVAVVGGNVSRARDLSVTVTALGAVPAGRAVLRSGARPGDLVAVTGTVGDAALGLRRGAARALVRRQRRPTPRTAAGLALAGLVRAAVDVSDGLAQDLGHLCEASGVGARIGLGELPLSPAYRRAARRLADPWAPALAGGEDYELVVAVAPASLPAARAAAARARTPLTVIGRFVRGTGVRVVGPRGEPVSVPAGHDHLRRRPLGGKRPGV